VTDGRSATRRAAESGVADTVLIDLALDYATAGRIAVAAAEQCRPAALPPPSASCRPPGWPSRASPTFPDWR
jgi:hypothetical protein